MKSVFFSILLSLVIPAFAEIKFTHRTDHFCTHQPVLYEIAMRTTGAIIEFGCGNGSTDLLHEICKQTGRILITVEDDLVWMQKFTDKYRGDGYSEDNSGWHKFFYIPGKYDHENPKHWIDFMDSCELLQTMDFDLCFIDQNPLLARYETIKRFKDRAKYIILHDCDHFAYHGIFGKVVNSTRSKNQLDFGDVFRNFKVYYSLYGGPPTLLGSNFEEDLPTINYADY